MKTVILNDSELKELEGLLNSAISECLDDSFVYPFEDEKKRAKEQANIYKKLYNKIIKNTFKED